MTIGARTEVDPAARAEHRRQQRIALATRGPWDEIPRRHLRDERFGVVVDERDEARFRIYRGEPDLAAAAIHSYFVTVGQEVVFLEKLAKR